MLGAAAAPVGKYVSPNGNNGNSGASPDQAWQTMTHAVSQLGPGDTLFVMEGEYFDSQRPDSAIVVGNSGTPDAWITITAQPGATPVLRSNQSNGIKVEAASYVEISNLELVGNPNEGTSRYSGAGINVDSIYGPGKNHHVRILNNRISGFGAGGVPVTGSSHVEIRNNVIHNLAEVEPSQHSGISILESFNMGFGDDANGYSNYITGNVIYQVENKVPDPNGNFTDGNCIIMDRTNINDYQGRTLIANNLCLDGGGRGIQIFESKHADVVNNTIYQNLKTPQIANSGGELGAFYSSDIEFANNLVFSRNGRKPARAFDSSGITFTNNLYVADTGAEYGPASNNGDNRVAPGTSVVASPGTNPNPANFALVGGSPAINAGTDKFNSVLGRDLVGAERVAGGRVDIGAIESSSSKPATTTPTTAAPTTAAPKTTAPKATTPKSTTPKTTSAPRTTKAKPPSTSAEPGSSTSAVKPPTTAKPGTTASPTTAAAKPPTSAVAEAPAVTVVQRPPTTVQAAAPTPTTAAAPRASSTSTAPETSLAAEGGVSPSAAEATTTASTRPTTASTRSTTARRSSSAAPPTRSFEADYEDNVYDDDAEDVGDADFDDDVDDLDFDDGDFDDGDFDDDDEYGDGAPSPADQADGAMFDFDNDVDDDGFEGTDESAAPEVLAFEADSGVPQAPVPVELPLAGLAAAGLLCTYYRPSFRIGRP